MRHPESAANHWKWPLVLVLALLAIAAPAHATLLVADFNDLVLTTAGVNGKGGGTGFSGTWGGSAGGNFVSGDLASSLYLITQGGTPQHYRSQNATGLRQNFRTPAASPTGTVWFSFLAMAEATGDRAGLSLNAPTGTPFDNTGTVYAYLVGNNLNYSFGTGTANTITGVGTLGSSSLIVGKMTINPGGAADSIQLWVNPNLITNPDITTLTPDYANDTINFIDTISNVGAIAARADGGLTGGGNVDSIRFSDGAGNATQAYIDVTGVPEPTSFLTLTTFAALTLLRRSRRPTQA